MKKLKNDFDNKITLNAKFYERPENFTEEFKELKEYNQNLKIFLESFGDAMKTFEMIEEKEREIINIILGLKTGFD